MGILDKIADLEAEYARTQKNKATEHHLGYIKGRIARLRTQLEEGTGKKGPGEGFMVAKSGDARISLIGFPSVGKSTILSALTETVSEAANYVEEFTTLTCIPGVLHYAGAKIQLLDTPGIIEGAAQGKGKGRQVVSVAKTADLLLMMLDATKDDAQRTKIEKELFDVGIRLNKQPPLIYFKKKAAGGVAFNSTCQLTKITERTVKTILHDYKIFHAEVLFREDATIDDFIDVIEGNRAYIPCVYAYNKIDAVHIEDLERLMKKPHSIVISANTGLNLDNLVDMCWEYLNLCRVYTKRRGNPPDFSDALILRNGKQTVQHACLTIHRDLHKQFKYGLVWGRSAKHVPQKVGLSHVLEDEDVLQIVKK